MRGRALLVILSIALLVFQNASAQETSPSAEHILFNDDFEDGDLAGWILSNSLDAAGVLEIEGNHVLHISGEQDTYVSLGFRGSQQWDAYVLEAQVMFVNDTSSRDRVLNFNLLGNAQGERGYSALISPRPASAFFADRKDGFEMMESSFYNPFQIQYNEWHLIRLEISHDLMTLLIDNAMVAQTQMDANRHGSPSFTIGPHMELYFDDVYVLNEGVPTANTTAAQVSLPEGSPLSPQDVLFYDDFEDGDLGGWNNYADAGEVIIEENENRVLRLTGTNWSGIQVGNHTWTDYVVETRIKIIQFTDGPTPSMFYNVRDSDGNNYNAGLGPNGVGMGLNFNGEYSALPATYISGMPFIQTNVWHIFRFQVFGDQLKLYFDGQLIAEYTVTENRLDHGLVSLVTAPNAEFYFDDVYVLSADVSTGLEPPALVFEFDNASAACSFDTLATAAVAPLTGVTLREVNVREAPSTTANVVSFLSVGESVTITGANLLGEEAVMRIEGRVRYSTVWLQVTFEQGDSERSGYVWGGAIQADEPAAPFANPYNACFPETDTTGWVEALTVEFGDNWTNYLNCNAYYYAGCSIFMVLDGSWITEPIPLWDANGELLAIVHISTRGYYLDAQGHLQSMLIPIYMQTDVNEAYLLYGGMANPEPSPFGFRSPAATLENLQNEFTDLRGRVACNDLAIDLNGYARYFSQGNPGFDASQLYLAASVTAYQEANNVALTRLAAAGDPSLGILLSMGGSSLRGCYADRDGDGWVVLP